MDREYIQNQIVLLLMGEETEISEREIRREMARDEELRKTYEETLTMLEITANRVPPAISEERWRRFSLDLHDKLARKQGPKVLKALAEFFRSPIRLGAAASVAAVLVIGIFVFLHSRLDPIDPPDVEVASAEGPEMLRAMEETIEEIDGVYATVEGLLPSEEELYLIEDIYAGFAQMDPDEMLEEIPGFYEYDIEDLQLLNGSNGAEDIS